MEALGYLRAALRLLLTLAVTLLGLLLVTFLIGRVVPIDPVLAAVGDRASPEVYERTKEELGLDLPLWQQFPHLCRRRAEGDLGESRAHRAAGARGHPPRLPGHARARHRGHPDRDRARRPDGRRWRPQAGPLAGPARPRAGPGRLLGPGLLARPDGPARCSTPSSAGSRGRAGSTSSTRTWSTPSPACS